MLRKLGYFSKRHPFFLRSKIEYILLIEKSVTSKLPAGYIEVNKAGYSYSTRRPVTETLVFSYKIASLLGHVLLLKKKKRLGHILC